MLESGEVTTSTQEVEIYPGWCAKKARLVVAKEGKAGSDKPGLLQQEPAMRMVKAKLVQLKKPLTGRIKSKIGSGYMEIAEGKREGGTTMCGQIVILS